MERWRTVQQDVVILNDIFENIPHLDPFALDQLFRAFHGLDQPAFFQFLDDKRLKQLKRHVFRKPALMQLEVGIDHNYRPAGIVDPLTEQILSEAALLSLK